MAEIEVVDGTVHVVLTAGEKAGGLRGNITFPQSAIGSVERSTDPIDDIEGLRAPGAGFPNRRIGTWRYDGKRDYVSVTRGVAGVIITIPGGDPFDRILLSLEDPSTADALIIP